MFCNRNAYQCKASLRSTAFHILFFINGFLISENLSAQQGTLVRIAKLEIEPAMLEQYKSLLKEEIKTSVRVEKGVLSLNAVAEKAQPHRITIFEIYADTAAYQSHLKSPHFKNYKTATQHMVKSLELIETEPVILRSKMQ